MYTPLLIIGAGPGGYETALLAAKRGLSVVIIEESFVGGTCLNEGCIPTKSFCKNAQVIADLKENDLYGIEKLDYSFNFNAVTERKNKIVEQLRKDVETLLSQKLIQLVKGKARFINHKEVDVNGERYQADHIIIATGSVTRYLPIEGKHLEGVLTSKEMLELNQVPERLCVIGAGVIGLEFASIFQRFGSKVTVLEFTKEILPRFDADLAKRLRLSLTQKGIHILTQTEVNAISKESDGMSVTFTKKGKTETLLTDKVLMAVGRMANVNSLNLDDIGLHYSPQGIVVNENMQTNEPHIYAIGDINGKHMLAHAATYQGIRALNHITGISDGLNLSIMPSAIFTFPEAATVGLTEEECRNQGIAYSCSKSFFRANGKALCMNEQEGVCKLLIGQNGIILGCHLFGAHAADLIQEVCALMTTGAKIDDFKNIIHGHPTLNEVVQSAVHQA